MVIRASTSLANFSIAKSAFFLRCAPSKVNGFVTTPTVKISCFLASWATTGPAPEPVPPPAPSVMNTISASLIASQMLSRLSSAAVWPFSGSPPAPRPWPMWTFTSAFEWCRAWASVFTAINSTPESPTSFMRFTAEPPAPPTPITLIVALLSTSVGFISGIFIPHF